MNAIGCCVAAIVEENIRSVLVVDDDVVAQIASNRGSAKVKFKSFDLVDWTKEPLFAVG